VHVDIGPIGFVRVDSILFTVVKPRLVPVKVDILGAA
jgi:hypothetical protein